MRLIDADALHFNRIRIAHEDGTVGGYNAVVMSAEIKDAPTIDAVPVVRCKDCKYGPVYDGIYRTRGECEFGDNGDDFFCAYGERRAKNEA